VRIAYCVFRVALYGGIAPVVIVFMVDVNSYLDIEGVLSVLSVFVNIEKV